MPSFKTHLRKKYLSESSFEEIQAASQTLRTNTEYLPTEDAISLLHELEYKLSKIIPNADRLNEKMLKNIGKLWLTYAQQFFDLAYDRMIGGFNAWKNQHQIQDAEAWANMVWDAVNEMYTSEEETINYLSKHGIEWGRSSLIPQEITQNINPERIKQFIREDILDDTRAYSVPMRTWLETKTTPKIQQTLEELDDAELVEYVITEYDLNEFVDWYLNTINYSTYIKDYEAAYLIYPADVRKVIAEFLYPRYMSDFGTQIQEIYKEVDVAVNRLKSANEHIMDLQLNFEKLEEDMKQLYKIVSEATIAVSLALNVNHVHGNILADYADISEKYMKNLHNFSASEWNQELKQTFGI